MTSPSKYHLPRGTSTDGPYELLVTPESAGWGHSGLRILTLWPGAEHALTTGENEFLVLPLNGGCTVAVDGRTFELGGRTDVFSAVSDFAYLPRQSRAVISSADGGTFALPSARTERGGHSARYGRMEDVPVEPRGAGACSRQVDNHCLPGGNWSPYPPHKEDIHCFQVAGGESGFGCQRVYGTPERPLDVMTGPEQDRAWLICDDPAHGWVRASWDFQDVDDRLPFGEAR